MSTYIWIALKYLVSAKREKFVSLMTVVSVLGVAIGVMTLIVVLGVMSGFDRDLKEKILGLNYPIIVEKEIGLSAKDPAFEQVSGVNGVEALSPYVNGQALLATPERFIGIHIRGIDLENEKKINNIASYIKVSSGAIGEQQILVGEELLKTMGLAVGDPVTLFSPITNKNYKFTVGGFFKSGYYDYDLNLVFANIPDVQKLMLMEGFYSGFGVKTRNIYEANTLREKLKSALGPDYRVRSWTDLNRNFFAALKLEKVTMFIILTLIVLVAAFNIISTLTVLVTNKTKDIGILKSIGLSSKGIKDIFILEGLLIGIVGIGLGSTVGMGLCALLAKYKFIQLPQDIYYIQYLPVYLRLQDVGLISIAAFLICILFTLYPARKASLLQPVEALRYE